MTNRTRIARILTNALTELDANGGNTNPNAGIWKIRLHLAELANRDGTDAAPVLVRNLSRNAVELLLDVYPATTLFDNGVYGTCDDPRVLAHGPTWILYATRDDVMTALDDCDHLKDVALDAALDGLNSDHEGRIAFVERTVERANAAMRRRVEEAWTTYEPVEALA